MGPPAIGEMVEASGFKFWAGGEPPERVVAPIRERLPIAPPEEASVLGNRELFGRLATAAMLPGMEHACTEWRPDLVLREPCEYASAVVAGRRGIPTAQVAISLAEAEAASISVAAPALEATRQGLAAELLAAPYLSRFPESLDPSPFPRTLRFHERGGSSGAPLRDWWAGSQAPLVYVTFGTVLGYMSVAAPVYRMALEAVGGLDIRVLFTVGRHFDPAELGSIPANVHVEAWVAQADAMAHAQVVVCHGGSGTTFGALAAGVPVVVVPLFADQFENGRRIAASRAGLVVEPEPGTVGASRPAVGQLDATRVANGIEKLLADHSYRFEARRIADRMAATPTVDAVLASLLSER